MKDEINGLPHAAEAERAILGAIILDNALIGQASELLKLSDFYVPSHRQTFSAMLTLSNRGSEIDPILIAEELRRDGSVEVSATLLTNLTYGLPHLSCIEKYAKVVREKSLLRRVLKVADKVTAEVLEASDKPETILANAQQQFEEIVANVGNKRLDFGSYADFMAQTSNDEEIIALESCRGEVVLIQSVTNKGKSTFIRNGAFCLAAGRAFAPFIPGTARRVLLLNFEGSRGRFQSDLRVMERVFDDAERDRIKENLFPVHAPEVDDEPLSLSRHMKLVEQKAGAIAPDVFIIDTASAAFNIRGESDNSEIADLMKRLIRLARKLNCLIVIVHHIGKAKAEDGQTREAAHRGRGASAFADFASAIFNLECDPSRDLVTVTCAKRKTGTGENYETTIRLDRNTRWFAPTSEAPPRPITNREQVLRALKQAGTLLRTAGVEQLLAGKMSERTVRKSLAALVADGLATQPKRGYWQIQKHESELGNSGNGHRELPICLTDNKDKDFNDLEPLGKLGKPLYELPELPSSLPEEICFPPGCDVDEINEREAIRAEGCSED